MGELKKWRSVQESSWEERGREWRARAWAFLSFPMRVGGGGESSHVHLPPAPPPPVPLQSYHGTRQLKICQDLWEREKRPAAGEEGSGGRVVATPTSCCLSIRLRDRVSRVWTGNVIWESFPPCLPFVLQKQYKQSKTRCVRWLVASCVGDRWRFTWVCLGGLNSEIGDWTCKCIEIN